MQVLGPCLDSPLCQEQLIESCKMVAAAVEKIVLAAQAACVDEDALRQLGAAATSVTESLRSLIQQIKVWWVGGSYSHVTHYSLLHVCRMECLLLVMAASMM